MRRITTYILIAITFTLCYSGACTESKQPANPCTYDTLSITSGKANRIVVSNRQANIIANVIVIEDSAKHVLAYKSKDGWQIVNAEKALEVLIADLENCKQKK